MPMKIHGWELLHFVSYSLDDNTAVSVDIKAGADWMLAIQKEIYKKYAEISENLIGLISNWINEIQKEKAEPKDDKSNSSEDSSDFDVVGYIDQQLSILDEGAERPDGLDSMKTSVPKGIQTFDSVDD